MKPAALISSHTVPDKLIASKADTLPAPGFSAGAYSLEDALLVSCT